jgi:hypothetical protein
VANQQLGLGGVASPFRRGRPLQVSAELHSSFARATGATILSANAGGGGGIFAGGGSILAQCFDEHKRQDVKRLVVADVPIVNPCRRPSSANGP